MSKMELDLTRTERPPLGTYPGVFVDAIEGTAQIKKQSYPTLSLVIELDRLNSNGDPFTIERRYILNTRGQRRLLEEVEKFLQAEGGLSSEQRKRFVPAEVFVGEPCQATVAYEAEGGRTVARASAFMPAGEKKLTPSGKYKRPEPAHAAPATSPEAPAASAEAQPQPPTSA